MRFFLLLLFAHQAWAMEHRTLTKELSRKEIPINVVINHQSARCFVSYLPYSTEVNYRMLLEVPSLRGKTLLEHGFGVSPPQLRTAECDENFRNETSEVVISAMVTLSEKAWISGLSCTRFLEEEVTILIKEKRFYNSNSVLLTTTTAKNCRNLYE